MKVVLGWPFVNANSLSGNDEKMRTLLGKTDLIGGTRGLMSYSVNPYIENGHVKFTSNYDCLGFPLF